MSISRCYRKHSSSVCEPQPFRKVTQISSTMIKGCTWLKFLNYQWWPHVLPKHVFPEGSRIFKQGKPQNPPSLGLPGGIQVEIRVVRSHLQIDPPGKFGSDPAGGGCHTITAAHKDISQQVLPLLLWGASTIGLQATQRNHGIIYLHPALKENKKKIPSMHLWQLYAFIFQLVPLQISLVRSEAAAAAARLRVNGAHSLKAARHAPEAG